MKPNYSDSKVTELALEIYRIVHAPYGEADPDKVSEIEDWLSGPGDIADYATAVELATEWRQIEAAAEADREYYNSRPLSL